MAGENELRELADMLVAERRLENVPTRKKIEQPKKQKPKRSRSWRKGLTFLERTKKKTRSKKRSRPRAPGGYSLVERLLARTDPGKWYSHAQLLAILPETTKSGLHALLYQKMPALGMIERRSVIRDPDKPWLEGLTCADRYEMARRSRYVYRIGAHFDAQRALAREKEAAYIATRREG